MNMADRSRYEIMTVREMAACQDDWLPCIFSKFSDAKIYKAHTGQRFSVGCAEVEVLYTQEEYPFDYVHKLNDTSMVTRVYYAGKTFLFPADIEGAAASKLLHDTYGKHLKSDYYQVAHHGWEAEALYYYHDVDPEVVLFPIRYRHWFRERYLSFPHATLVKKEMDEGTRKVCPSLTEDWIFEF